MNKLKQTLKTVSGDELKLKVEDLRRELFSLRLHATKFSLKDVTQFKKLRRAIACGLTLMNNEQNPQK